MELIRAYFNRFIPLGDTEWQDFEACIHKIQVKKRHKLIREGQTCDFIAFIGEGAFRFYYEQDGEEKITAFFFAGDFATDYRSFLSGQPSAHNIECMKAATIYKIYKKDLQALYDKHKAMERLGRLIAENLYLMVARRLDSFMFASPEARYQELLRRNSKLLQDVPQYMIASYLGIKPETLSRIRARI